MILPLNNKCYSSHNFIGSTAIFGQHFIKNFFTAIISQVPIIPQYKLFFNCSDIQKKSAKNEQLQNVDQSYTISLNNIKMF